MSYEAIYAGEFIYIINPAKCTECIGHFDVPQSQEVCSVECIISDLDHPPS